MSNAQSQQFAEKVTKINSYISHSSRIELVLLFQPPKGILTHRSLSNTPVESPGSPFYQSRNRGSCLSSVLSLHARRRTYFQSSIGPSKFAHLLMRLQLFLYVLTTSLSYPTYSTTRLHVQHTQLQYHSMLQCHVNKLTIMRPTAL